MGRRFSTGIPPDGLSAGAAGSHVAGSVFYLRLLLSLVRLETRPRSDGDPEMPNEARSAFFLLVAMTYDAMKPSRSILRYVEWRRVQAQASMASRQAAAALPSP